MKKFTSVTVLSLAVALFAVTQFGCASPQPTTSTNANMATPAPTPDKAAIEGEIMKIENDWPRIIKDHDVATVKKLRHLTIEEGEQKSADMSPVHVSVGHNHDAVIAQLGQIKIFTDARAQSRDQGPNFGVAEHAVQTGFFDI